MGQPPGSRPHPPGVPRKGEPGVGRRARGARTGRQRALRRGSSTRPSPGGPRPPPALSLPRAQGAVSSRMAPGLPVARVGSHMQCPLGVLPSSFSELKAFSWPYHEVSLRKRGYGPRTSLTSTEASAAGPTRNVLFSSPAGRMGPSPVWLPPRSSVCPSPEQGCLRDQAGADLPLSSSPPGP